jgi:amidophosphoribosyltransferase
LVKALKSAGAKKVYLLSASPMIKWPCFLGIDTPTRDQLIANKHTLNSMQKIIGCDYLGFLSLQSLIKSCGGKDKFCSGCFTGKYPIRNSNK